MVCSDCKYPYVPSSGKCPSCGHQNTDWGAGLVILFLLFVFFILFLPVFLVGIGLYNGGKKLKYIFGWILVAYFAYSMVDGFNRWFMYEGLIWILKDYIAIGYILNFVGLIFGIAWISKGYKPDTPQHEESVIKDEEDEYEETENTIEEVNTSKSPNFEDIKKAKELLDLGAISQEEFDNIKNQALGIKTKSQVVQKIETVSPQSQNQVTYPAAKPFSVNLDAKKHRYTKTIVISVVAVAGIAVLIVSYNYFVSESKEEQYSMEFTENTISVPIEPEPEVEAPVNENIAQEEQEALPDSYYEGFLLTPTGERYKKVIVQVPNHDEAGTISKIEIIGPVEGIYFNSSEGPTTYIKIQYDNDKIWVSSWKGDEQSTKEEGYVTSKGLLSFGGQEFDYDRFDESIADVRALTLTNSAGVSFLLVL